MAYDAHPNFAYSTVATAPSPATSGTSLVVASGDGTKFATTPPFNAVVWPAGAQPSSSNAEIVRITNRSTDTLTITRTQESTSARTIVVGDQIAVTITQKTLTDIEGLLYNPYKFAAYASGTTVIGSGTTATVNLATEEYDTNNNFASNVYTAPVTGFYKFDGAVMVTTGGANEDYIAAIYKNSGTEFKRGVRIRTGGSGDSIYIVSPPPISLTAGDTIELKFYNGTGGTKTVQAGQNSTYFGGFLVSQT